MNQDQSPATTADQDALEHLALSIVRGRTRNWSLVEYQATARAQLIVADLLRAGMLVPANRLA